MTLGSVKAGDIVLADRKGRRFFGVVTERRERELAVDPIDQRVTYRVVTAREVIGIWHKTRPTGRDRTSGRMSVVEADTILVVEVEETITAALAGHEGCRYASPPLPRVEALALVRVLIGRDVRADGECCWRCAIAGGQRTVSLRTTAGIGHPNRRAGVGGGEENV